MTLVEHATNELQRAGLFDKDADYGGAIAIQVMELIETFTKQGHSGFSAEWTLDLFNKLVRFKTLTPITSDPDEWIDRTAMSNAPLWQSKRCPSYFSTDGGKTWYDIDAKEQP